MATTMNTPAQPVQAQANPYDQILDAQTPGAAAVPAQPNRYDQILDQQDVDLNQKLMQTIATSAGNNPDVSGEAQRLGFQVGVGPDIARRNMDEVRRRATIMNAQSRYLAANSPILAQQLTDPNFADIAHDDLDNLSTTEKVFNWAKSVPGDVANQWEAGQLQHEMGLLGFKAETGAATADDWNRINAIKQRLAQIGPRKTFVGSIAQMGGQMKDMGVGALTAAGIGGLAAGGATAWASGGLAAEAVPEATMMGARAAGRFYASQDIYRMTAGQAYLDMRDKGIEDQTAQFAAAGVGAINTALMMGGIKIAGEPFANSLGLAIGERLTDAMARPTVARALQNVAGHWALNTAEGGLIMGGQQAVNELAMNAAELHDTGKFDLETEQGRQQFAGRVVDSFVNGLELTGAVHATGSLLQFGMEANRAQEAQRAQQFFAGLTENAADSKVRGRNPNAYENFIAAQAAGSGAENVYVDGKRMSEAFHQSGIDPEKFDEAMPGVRDQMNEAAATGGDVVIPTEQYAARLAGTDLGKAMLPHMRLDPDAMSAAEATEFAANQKEMLAEAQQRAAAEMSANEAFSQSAKKVEQDLFDQIKATQTMPDNVARTNAQFMRDLIVTQAADLGVSPEEFYEQYKPSIERSVSGDVSGVSPLRQEAVQSIRTVVEAAKQPGHAPQKVIISPVDDQWLVKTAKEHGLDIEGFHHSLDGSAVRHVLSEHGNAKTEESRGQVALTEQDFERIPDVLENPDSVVFGTKSRVGRDQIGFIKQLEDGSFLHLEEVRNRRKELAAVSMRKYPATMDADRVAATVHLNARSDSGTEPIVVRNPNAGKTLYQAARGGFDPSRLAIILGDKADFSTFAHETAHYYLTVLGDLARKADENTPGRFKKDMGTLLNWFGVKDQATWDAMSLEEQRKYHEQFAYNFERYLADGKAPSLELQGVFDRMKIWMQRIYTTIRDNINVVYKREHGTDLPVMTGEVRDVMDRMLASEEQIRHAQAVRNMEPLFSSKASALEHGMSEEDWNDYRNQVKATRDEATAELSARSLRDMQWLSRAKSRVMSEMQAEHDALRAETRAEVEKEVQGADLYRAQRWLKTGEMEGPDGEQIAAESGYKLNSDAVKAMFAGKPGAPDLTKLRGMTAEDGMHPDTVAPMFGFDGGEQLVRNLADARSLKDEVNARTDQRMLERYGDMNSPEEIERRTNEALHNDARARMLATELKFVQKLQQPARILQEAARNVAQRILAEKRIGDISERDYIAAEAKAERAARVAMRKGDNAGVAKAVEDRLLQNALAKQAIAARAEVDQTLKYLQKFDRPSVAITKKIGADYMDRINELLAGYELSQRAPLGQGRQDISSWVQSEYAKTGILPAISDELIMDLGSMHWKDMTLDQLRGLHDAVKSLDYIGRRRTQIELEGKTVEVDELVQQVKDRLKDVKHSEPVDLRADLAHAKGLDKVEARFLQLKGKLRSLDAALLKMEQFYQWMDAGKDAGVKEAPADGPMSRLFRLASNAEGKERAMRAESAAALRKLGEQLRDQNIDLNERLEVPELPRADGSTKMYREELLAVALNMGNESNREKLFYGYNWSDLQVQSAINRLLSKPEMDFVQGVWDHIGGYGKDIVELQRRQTGVTPKMIKPSAVETAHGVYRGGYYPVVYDSFLDRSIEEKQARSADQLFENNYAKPATNKGHTIERTGYKGPLYLSLGVIGRHIDQVTHDLAWREAITDMNKVLTDARLQREVEETYGREYARQFRPWLQAMANDRVFDTSGDAAWEGLIRQARTNATLVGVGFRLSTLMVHGTSALSNSMGELGAKWFMKGVQQFVGMDRLQQGRDFVFARSPEMAHRMDAVDRNITEAINEINRHEADLKGVSAATHVMDQARKFACYGVAMSDMASALPTWMGAYLKGMAKEADGGLNLTETDAVEYANRAVRNAHGGGGVKDFAAVQRDKGVISLATMFYSFWNHMYNRQRDLAKGWGAVATGHASTNNLPRLLARSWFYFVIPQLAHAMLKPSPAEKKEESEGDLAAFSESVGKDIGLGMFSGVPIVRDLASAAVNGRDYAVTPLEQAGKSIVTTVGNAEHLAKGEPPSNRAFQNTAETAGYVFGIPTAQPAATTKFLWDVMNGDADPQSVKDWYRGVLTGRLR